MFFCFFICLYLHSIQLAIPKTRLIYALLVWLLIFVVIVSVVSEWARWKREREIIWYVQAQKQDTVETALGREHEGVLHEKINVAKYKFKNYSILVDAGLLA